MATKKNPVKVTGPFDSVEAARAATFGDKTQTESVMSDTLELGRWVKDLVTGFAGVAVSVNYFVTGTIQVSVQPQVKSDSPGTLPDAYNIDVNSLVYAAPPEGFVPVKWNKPSVTLSTLGFHLGNRVRDPISELTGIVTQVLFMLNGCVYAVVAPPKTKDGDVKGSLFLEYRTVKYLDEGIAESYAPKTLMSKVKDAFKRSPKEGEVEQEQAKPYGGRIEKSRRI